MLGIEFRLPEVDWIWAVRAFLAHFALGFWVTFLVVSVVIATTRPKWFSTDFGSILKLAFWGAVFSNLSDLDHVTLFMGHEDGRILHTPLAWVGVALIAWFFSFSAVTRRPPCDRPDCPTCVHATACVALWKRRIGFAALMGLDVIVHVLEDYYIGAF